MTRYFIMLIVSLLTGCKKEATMGPNEIKFNNIPNDIKRYNLAKSVKHYLYFKRSE